jgi:hypothetical protein
MATYCDDECGCGQRCARSVMHTGNCDCGDIGHRPRAYYCPKCQHATSLHHGEKGHTQPFCHARTGLENDDVCCCTHGAPVAVPVMLKVWAVRRAGKWAKTPGTSYAKKWVDDLVKAKIYGDLRQAKARVTYWARLQPKEGVPELVEFTITETRVIDQVERVKQADMKKVEEGLAKQLVKEKRALDEARAKLQRAQDDYDSKAQSLRGRETT